MIRLFKEEDFPMICEWWNEHREPAPTRDLIPEYTYVLEKNEVPILCLSLITTSSSYAISAGLISNPKTSRIERDGLVKELWDYVAGVAKWLGYKNLTCLAPNESLEKHYARMGFVTTRKNMAFMVRNLGE